MNRALSIAAFATGTLALALSLVPRDAPQATQAPAANAVTTDDLELLERRIDAVEDLHRDLLNRVAQLQRTGVSSDAGVSGDTAGLALEVAKLREEMRGMVAGEALHSEGGKAWLKETMREMQADDMRARVEQQVARNAERSEEHRAQWKKFVGDNHLDYAQEQALMKQLDAEAERRKALLDEARGTTGRNVREVQRELRDLRRETDRAVKGALSADQAARYDQLRREQNQPARGMFGGGERGGPFGGR